MKVLQLDKNLNVSKSEWIIIVNFSKKFIIHIVTVFGRCVHKERGNDVKKEWQAILKHKFLLLLLLHWRLYQQFTTIFSWGRWDPMVS